MNLYSKSILVAQKSILVALDDWFSDLNLGNNSVIPYTHSLTLTLTLILTLTVILILILT